MKIQIQPERKSICKMAYELALLPLVTTLGLGLELIKKCREVVREGIENLIK